MSRRLIQHPDMKETCSIIFSYILLHFIEMYMLYLAACKPRITQKESTMRDERIKTHTKKMLLKLKSLRPRNKSQT